MLKSTQTSSGLLWFCYKVLVQAPWHCSLQETHQLWQIAMTWVPTGTKWPRGCHQNPSIRTFVWDHIFPNISWDKVRTFALQTLSFTTSVCLQRYWQATFNSRFSPRILIPNIRRMLGDSNLFMVSTSLLKMDCTFLQMVKKTPLWWQWIHTDVNTRKQYSNVWAQI